MCISRTMDSFDISSDSEEGLLDEIVVGSNYHQQRQQQNLQRFQYYQQQQQQWQPVSHHASSASFLLRTQHKQYYEPTMESPIHYCDYAMHSDDNSCATQENQQQSQRCSSSQSNLNMPFVSDATGSSTSAAAPAAAAAAAKAQSKTLIDDEHDEDDDFVAIVGVGDVVQARGDGVATANDDDNDDVISVVADMMLDTGQQEHQHSCIDDNVASGSSAGIVPVVVSIHATATDAAASTSAAAAAGASFNHQLTADMCNYKNSKSRRLEYSLKCLKYARSNPSQDSAFGSLTDNDLSIGSSSFRLSSFQSISSPIDEGVEDVIIATTTAGNETCLELATIPRSMVSQDSAISSPCRESSPSNFLNIDDALSAASGGSCSGGSTSSNSGSGSLGANNIMCRPQQFPVSLSPKILVTATTNSSNSSLASINASSSNNAQQQQQQQQQQFDPPKILVNDQNSIYTTSPSKRSGTIEVFSQKYRVSSFEDMSPNKRASSSASDKHLKHVNRLAFRSLEEERRIDNAFLPIADRTNSDNRVNFQSEKYKKLTHASFRISKTSSQVAIDCSGTSPVQQLITTSCSTPASNSGSSCAIELQRTVSSASTSAVGSRQTMWRDSKFYRKNRIAKSNDSLLETSPNHSARLSPSSLRDNHYDSSCCSSSSHGSRSHSRQSLHRGSSINEMLSSSQPMGRGTSSLHVTTSFCVNVSANGRRYCSSKSEDLGGESSDYLRVMDARKSYSERHLVSCVKLKQTAINNTNSGSDSREQCCLSEDEMSFNDDNNASSTSNVSYGNQQQQHHQQQQQQQTAYMQRAQKQQQQQQQQQQHYVKRSNAANQLSWSSSSINHLKTTNIKTTSLATLSCQTNLANTPSAHTTANQLSKPNTSISGVAKTCNNINQRYRSTTSKSLDQALNLTENNSSSSGSSNSNSNSSSSSSASCGGANSSSAGLRGLSATHEDNSSSADESPSRRTLSGAELSRIFVMDMDDAPGSSCSEEKTPLLDSVEMSPISPTEPELDKL